MSKCIGIDISKQTFDACFFAEGRWQHAQYTNSACGFAELLAHVEPGDMVVMEASGPYYLPLAGWLYQKGVLVVVENPLAVKRYAQSRLYRAKTDKKDARTLAEYGTYFVDSVRLWQPEAAVIMDLRQLFTHLELLDKQIQQCSRQLEAFRSSGHLDEFLQEHILSHLAGLQASRNRLQAHMETLAKQHFGYTLACLQSIPGIGLKAAVLLTLITGNFSKFERAGQLTAYVGLSPRVYQSGTSVQGRGHICKMGQAQIRKVLYMCSWSAKRYNPDCVAMYERLAARNKPERVIKVAIANKLLRIAFAVGKSQTMYQENCSPKTCI